jgi:hypothetical protein
MNTTTNILFLLVPEELVGSLLLFMLIAGGFAFIVGARRAGKVLVVSAIAFPFISVIVSALFNDFFATLPPSLVLPVAFLVMAVLYVSTGWMILKGIFGQKAVDHAKGELLADGVRAALRLVFSKTGLVLFACLVGLACLAPFVS